MKREDIIKEECKAELELYDIEYEGVVGLEDALELVGKMKAEMFDKGVEYANRWRKVSEELPSVNEEVLVKTLNGYYHTAEYKDYLGGEFYSITMKDLDGCPWHMIDDVLEWKPID